MVEGETLNITDMHRAACLLAGLAVLSISCSGRSAICDPVSAPLATSAPQCQFSSDPLKRAVQWAIDCNATKAPDPTLSASQGIQPLAPDHVKVARVSSLDVGGERAFLTAQCIEANSVLTVPDSDRVFVSSPRRPGLQELRDRDGAHTPKQIQLRPPNRNLEIRRLLMTVKGAQPPEILAEAAYRPAPAGQASGNALGTALGTASGNGPARLWKITVGDGDAIAEPVHTFPEERDQVLARYALPRCRKDDADCLFSVNFGRGTLAGLGLATLDITPGRGQDHRHTFAELTQTWIYDAAWSQQNSPPDQAVALIRVRDCAGQTVSQHLQTPGVLSLR